MNLTSVPTTNGETRGPAQYAAFCGMCLIWGTTFFVIRVGNEAVAPVWAATLRLVIAAALSGIVALATGAEWPRGEALRASAVFGFLNLGVNFVLLYWGEQTVPSGVAAVLYATGPLSTAIFASMLGLHALERRKMFAAVAGLAGVSLIFSGELRLGASSLALIGILTGATVSSLAGVILKQSPPQPAFVVNAVGAAVGAVVCFAGSAILGEPWVMPRTLSGWGPIVYLAVAGNLGAYVLYAWLLTQWRVTSVSIGALIVPVIAMMLGVALRGEAPALATYAGAGLVLAGVAVGLFNDQDA